MIQNSIAITFTSKVDRRTQVKNSSQKIHVFFGFLEKNNMTILVRYGLVLLFMANITQGLQTLDWLDDENVDGFEIVYPQVHSNTQRFRRSLDFNSSNELGDGEESHDKLEIDYGEKNSTQPVLIVIKGFNRTFFLELHPVGDVLDGRFIADPNTNNEHGVNVSNCLFRGRVISQPEGVASFSLCGGPNSMYGSWVTPEGHFVLRPSATNESDIGHRLRKLEPSVETEGESFCGTSGSGVETPRSVYVGNTNRRKRQVWGPTKVIETAVYADTALNKKFVKKYKNQPLKQLSNYIMAILNEVQLVYNFDSMKTKIKIVLVKFDILKQDGPGTGGGNIDKYLDNFCRWQAKKGKSEKVANWDHAIMLTGLNLFKMNNNGKKSDKVLGQAWVNGMCIPIYSCTINEGDDFEAAYVIAHEMGHNLGMAHDGDKNNCDSNKFIMSPVTGGGKITWSGCSNTALEKFLMVTMPNRKERNSQARKTKKMQTSNVRSDQVKTCLNNDAYPSNDLDYTKTGLPGIRYPPSAQCKLSMGAKYDAYMPNKAPYNNICYELWCISGMVATTTHPALDGSTCGSGKICRQGKCVNG